MRNVIVLLLVMLLFVVEVRGTDIFNTHYMSCPLCDGTGIVRREDLQDSTYIIALRFLYNHQCINDTNVSIGDTCPLCNGKKKIAISYPLSSSHIVMCLCSLSVYLPAGDTDLRFRIYRELEKLMYAPIAESIQAERESTLAEIRRLDNLNNMLVPCPQCGGKGYLGEQIGTDPWSRPIVCPLCGGTGQVTYREAEAYRRELASRSLIKDCCSFYIFTGLGLCVLVGIASLID